MIARVDRAAHRASRAASAPPIEQDPPARRLHQPEGSTRSRRPQDQPRRACPISAPAARTTRRRKVPEGSRATGRHRLPRDGDLDGPQTRRRSRTWAAKACRGSARRRSPTRSTCSRTSATAPTTTAGILAIRAAVAASVNITYKILYNDAVAMTGGQPFDGPLTPRDDRAAVRGRRRVAKIVVVTDEPDKYPADYFADRRRRPPSRRARRRAEAAARDGRHDDPALRPDLRRREAPPPQARQVPRSGEARRHQRARLRGLRRLRRQVELRVGRAASRPSSAASARSTSRRATRTTRASTASARASSPSKAASCASRRRPRAIDFSATCPQPAPASSSATPYGMLVTGIGGTGVVTIGALLGMAAHLEGKGCSVLDMTGLAQKNGAVVSHVRIADTPEQLHATRIAAGEAKLVLACDILTGVGYEALAKMQKGVTKALVNTALVMPAQFTREPDLAVPDGLDGAGDQGCRRAGRRRVPRRDEARDRPDGRLDRDQPVHGRLRVSARPAAARRGGDPARDRAERRRGRVEQAELPLGPPRGVEPAKVAAAAIPHGEARVAAPVGVARRDDRAPRARSSPTTRTPRTRSATPISSRRSAPRKRRSSPARPT